MPTKRQLSDVANRFDHRAGTYDRQSLWVSNRKVLQAMLLGLGPGQRVLDVAGGTGVLAAEGARAGIWITCADLSKGMLLQAKARHVPVVNCDMHKLPFGDDSFDVVMMRQGLQYANLAEIFLELSRVARAEVRIGQIVAENQTSLGVWKHLFQQLGQKDRKVFVAGELETLASLAGLSFKWKRLLSTKERLVTPNADVVLEGAQKLRHIGELIRSVSRKASFSNGDWIHDVRWEIVCFTVS